MAWHVSLCCRPGGGVIGHGYMVLDGVYSHVVSQSSEIIEPLPLFSSRFLLHLPYWFSHTMFFSVKAIDQFRENRYIPLNLVQKCCEIYSLQPLREVSYDFIIM